jgi:HEPN domain-containing protein
MNNPFKEWFKKGDNDLLDVENNIKADNFPADTVCYHCQQVAEKYLKGFLTYHSKPIEKTHNLIFLYNQCLHIEAGIKEIEEDLINLNDYSTTIRYPDYIYNPTDEDAIEAYQQAKKIRLLILSKVKID